MDSYNKVMGSYNDPYNALNKDILERRPDYKSSDEELEKLVPWSDKVQDICK